MEDYADTKMIVDKTNTMFNTYLHFQDLCFKNLYVSLLTR